MHADDDALWALALEARPGEHGDAGPGPTTGHPTGSGTGSGVPTGTADRAAGGRSEDVDDDLRAHVDGCPACSTELAARRRVVAAGRRPPEHLELRPSQRVLDGVLAQVGLARPTESTPGGATAGGDRPPSAPAATAGAPVPAPRERGPVAGRSRRALALAAVVGVVLGAGAGAAVTAAAGRAGEGGVVARADLEPLGATGARGTAVLRAGERGDVLEVDLEDAGSGRGSYEEVWLLDEPSGGLLSLGALVDGHGVFTVPPGALPAEQEVQVDVSREALDGQPTHSGDSLARGALSTGA
ncbi:anti-sigma factor domain-containing protein [uncultured Pseudokineococcus sp.]|uniref:anti-sigma factor domain-containing protein n=1 Tax=uncultured Pseudokineococcus sp. TaxID=1642928 RepID=UPI00263298C1|nr:anti-sigma factor [uncultured Pseudokineococcus sp.]